MANTSHVALGAAVGMSLVAATVLSLCIAAFLALREVRGLKKRIAHSERAVPQRPPALHGHGVAG
jgi:hypothetical protein